MFKPKFFIIYHPYLLYLNDFYSGLFLYNI